MTHKGLVKCITINCNKKHLARGYCKNHYMQLLRNGKIERILIRDRILQCSIEGCEKEHEAKSFCRKHYARFRKYGDPLFVKLIMDPDRGCKVQNCTREHIAKGYCGTHYKTFLCQSSRNNKDMFLQVAMNIVRARDKNTCKWYGCERSSRNGYKIHVHHIFPRAEYPNLKYIEEYMICYCVEHHREWHKARGDKCWKSIY